jgi:hypothetical protein
VFKFEIHRKAASAHFMPDEVDGPSEMSEDWLTSDALATAACYLPAKLVLLPFLREVARQNSHAPTLDPHLDACWGKALTATFWPPFPLRGGSPVWGQSSIEPDALLEWEAGPAIFIEAKFTEDVDADQLAREAFVGLDTYGLERFYLLLITRDLMPPRIAREFIQERVAARLANLSFGSRLGSVDQIKQRILWCNWQTLYKVADRVTPAVVHEDMSVDFPLPTLSIIKDLLEVLNLRGLIPFQALAYDYLAKRSPNLDAFTSWDSGAPCEWLDLKELASRSPSVDALDSLLLRTR